MQNAQTSCQRSAGRHSPSDLRDFFKHAAGLGIALMVVAAAGGSRADVAVQAREPTPDEIASAATPPVAPESRLTITANVPFEKVAAVANRFQLATHAKGTIAGFISYEGVLSLGKVKLLASDQPRFPIRVVAPFALKGTLGGRRSE